MQLLRLHPRSPCARTHTHTHTLTTWDQWGSYFPFLCLTSGDLFLVWITQATALLLYLLRCFPPSMAEIIPEICCIVHRRGATPPYSLLALLCYLSLEEAPPPEDRNANRWFFTTPPTFLSTSSASSFALKLYYFYLCDEFLRYSAMLSKVGAKHYSVSK